MRPAALLAGLALTAVALPGGAQASTYQDAELGFTKSRPGASTGLRFQVDYVQPEAPEAQPPPVRRVVLDFARGTRIDTSAPEHCEASDEELMVGGAAFCPASTQVGSGDVVVDTGFPGAARFVEAEIDFLNNDHELIYINTVRGTSARTIIRAKVSRRRVETVVAPLPGTPPGGGAIDTAVTHFPALSRTVDGELHNYVTTPGSCPPRGWWRNRIHFSYDGDVTQTVVSRSPCANPRGRG